MVMVPSKESFREVILSYVTVHKGNQAKVWSKALGEHTVRELFLCIMATVATAMTMQDNVNRPTARYSFCFFFILVPAPAAHVMLWIISVLVCWWGNNKGRNGYGESWSPISLTLPLPILLSLLSPILTLSLSPCLLAHYLFCFLD